jgi:hypothetical protein
MNSVEIRKGKNSYIHVLLHKTKMREQKDALLSNYGVESVTDLSDEDIDDLTQRLETLANTANSDAPKHIRELRSKCIIAAESYLGFQINGKEAWQVFNTTMLDKRVCGKMLRELDETELKTLHQKLRSMSRKQQDKATTENLIAPLN